jgi:branched-chain amino acid transport system permease protein
MTVVMAAAAVGPAAQPWGKAFTALRDNPIRAESLGVDIRSYTLLSFAIGAAYAGVAGALFASLVQFIEPAPFAVGASIMMYLMVVVGGPGYFFGPVLGAAVGVLLPEWLRFAQAWYLFVFGARGGAADDLAARRAAEHPRPPARPRQAREGLGARGCRAARRTARTRKLTSFAPREGAAVSHRPGMAMIAGAQGHRPAEGLRRHPGRGRRQLRGPCPARSSA